MPTLDANGKGIVKGSFVRCIYEPLPPKYTPMPGDHLGDYWHNFFGVKQVSEVRGTTIIFTDGYVAGAYRCEVVPTQSHLAPYKFPYSAVVRGLAA